MLPLWERSVTISQAERVIFLRKMPRRSAAARAAQMQNFMTDRLIEAAVSRNQRNHPRVPLQSDLVGLGRALTSVSGGKLSQKLWDTMYPSRSLAKERGDNPFGPMVLDPSGAPKPPGWRQGDKPGGKAVKVKPKPSLPGNKFSGGQTAPTIPKTQNVKPPALLGGGKEPLGPSYISPAARGVSVRNKQPVLTTMKDGITVKHREFVGDFSGTTTYDIQSYNVTPTNGDLFPYLSTLARSWTYYKFTKLSFHIEPSIPNSVGGVIMLLFQPDPTSDVPADKQTMLNTDGSERCVAWSPASVNVSPSWMNQVEKFSIGRGFPLDTNSTTALQVTDLNDDTDSRLDLCGRFSLAVDQYTVATATAGELWVEYEVKLSIPAIGKHLLNSCMVYTNGSTTVNPNGPGAYVWNFVPGGLLVSNAYFPATAVVGQIQFYIYTPGTYLVLCRIYGTGMSAVTIPSQDSGIEVEYQGTGFFEPNVGATEYFRPFLVKVSDTEKFVRLSQSSTTVTNMSLVVVEVAPQSLSATL